MTEVGVLDRVMAILHAFPAGSTRLQPPAVAKVLDISTPTVYRLMKSMADHGLLDYGTEGYRLGVTLLKFGALVADGLDLVRIARPLLERLRDQTSENAGLHLLHGSVRVPIDVVTSSQNLRPMGQVGVPLSLYAGASAKVLLAWLPADEREALVLASHGADPQPPPFDMRAWEQDLARTRSQGWAVSDGEREPGVSSIAVPVRDRTGSVVAAIVVSGASIRLTSAAVRAAALEAAIDAAAELSGALGGECGPTTRRLV